MKTEIDAFFVSKVSSFYTQVQADSGSLHLADHAARAVILIDTLEDAYGSLQGVIEAFSANSYDARPQIGLEGTMLRVVAEYAISALHEGYDALLEKISDSFYPSISVAAPKVRSMQLEDIHRVPRLWDHHGKALHNTLHFIKTSSQLAVDQLEHFTDSNAEALEVAVDGLVSSGLGESKFFKFAIVRATSCLAFRNAPLNDPGRLAILSHIDPHKECLLRFSEMIDQMRDMARSSTAQESVDNLFEIYQTLPTNTKEQFRVYMANQFFVMQMSTKRADDHRNMCLNLKYFFTAAAKHGSDALSLMGMQNLTDTEQVVIMTRDLTKMMGHYQSSAPEFAAVYAGALLALDNTRLLQMELGADQLLALYSLKKEECFKDAMLARDMPDAVLALDLGL